MHWSFLNVFLLIGVIVAQLGDLYLTEHLLSSKPSLKEGNFFMRIGTVGRFVVKIIFIGLVAYVMYYCQLNKYYTVEWVVPVIGIIGGIIPIGLNLRF